MTTSKYDDAKVEALLDRVEKLLSWLRERSINPGPEVIALLDAVSALRPPVEMEYVMPEWVEFTEPYSTGGSVVGGEYVRFNGFQVSMNTYNAIREATRRPKRDLVPAGSEWSSEDIEALFPSVAGLSTRTIGRRVIDAIKAKCGV